MSKTNTNASGWRLERVVSGGQTGVDRAALDVALELGIPCGGWCPKGRMAEDGTIDAKYPLQESPTANYAERTALNVKDSDGTLILSHSVSLRGGTALTKSFAERYQRPWFVLNLHQPGPISDVVAWLSKHSIRILNVAGPRESSKPGTAQQAADVIRKLLNSATSPTRSRRVAQTALKKLATASITESNVSK